MSAPHPIFFDFSTFYKAACEMEKAKVARLRHVLKECRISHTECEDSWYSCPKSSEGCADDRMDVNKCNCGADAHNKEIDRVLWDTRDATEKKEKWFTPSLKSRQNGFGQYQTVYVVFTDESRMWWLKGMKRGFRHCFVLLNDKEHWIAMEPLAHCTELTVLPSPPDFDLPTWIRGQGHHVVEAILDRTSMRMPIVFLYTCVEAVKRVLGLKNFFVWTPYQLYKHLLIKYHGNLTKV